MISLFRFCLNVLVGLVVIILVLLAIAVGVARVMVYEVEGFEADISRWISEQTGIRVECSTLTGSWQGLAPRFQFTDLEIVADPSTGPGIQARHVDLEVLLFHSLVNLQPRVRLTIDGARLVADYEQGYLKLGGFHHPDPESLAKDEKAAGGSQYWVDTLMSQPWLAFTDSELVIRGIYDDPVTFSLPHFQFESGSVGRYVNGQLDVDGPSRLLFNMRGRVHGSVFRKDSLAGQLYLKLEPADWHPWLEFADDAQVSVDALQGGGEFWLRLQSGKIAGLVSRFDLDQFDLATTNDITPPQIERLSGTMEWSGEWLGDWRLVVEDLQMQTTNFLWEPSVLNLAKRQLDETRVNYIANVDGTKITPWLNYYLSVQPSDNQWHQMLTQLKPSGEVKNLFLDLEFAEQKLADYEFSIALNDFSNQPLDLIPGLEGLNLTAWGEQDRMYLVIDDDQVTLNYPEMFRQTLALTRIEGALRVGVLEDHIEIQSSVIQGTTPDWRSASQFSATIPKNAEESPFVRFQSTFRAGVGQHASTYMPAGLLDEGTLEWLDQAIVKGDLLRGDIIFHGPTQKDQAEPRGVLLGFSLDNASVSFDVDWDQTIDDGFADIVVDGGEVSAHILGGRYFGQEVVAGTLYLPAYEEGKPQPLRIKGKTLGDASTGINVLKETPLQPLLGDFIHDVSILQGNLALDMDIEIPLNLRDTEEVRADVDVSLSNTVLDWPDAELYLENLAGKLNFNTDSGLSANKVTGTRLGGKFSGRIETQGEGLAEKIVVFAEGDASVEEIKAWADLGILDPASGRIQYDLRVDIPTADVEEIPAGEELPILVDLHSNLEGVAIDLPKPFTKPESSKVPFSALFGIHEDYTDVWVNYGRLMNTHVRLVDDELQKGAVQFGTKKAKLPSKDRLTLAGELSYLDYDEWYDYLDALATEDEDEDEDDSSWQRPLKMLDDSSLRVEQLVFSGYQWGVTDFLIYNHETFWRGTIDNPAVSGLVQLPFSLMDPTLATSASVISLQMGRMHFPDSEEEEGAEPELSELSPRGLPPVEIQIESFKVGDTDLGSWLVNLEPLEQGMRINSINANLGETWITGEGRWIQPVVDGPSVTQVDLAISGKDIGKAFAGLLGDPMLSSRESSGKATLSWPGGPHDFYMSTADGDIELKIVKGRLYETDAPAIGKLWSAINLEHLLRRLSGDFGDISKSEIVYDDISSVMQIKNNYLKLEELKMKTPLVSVRANGDLNLATSTVQMDMDVTIPVTPSLILPAALIAGLPGGVVALLMEKILGDQFDKLTTFQYRVTGDVENPTFVEKNQTSNLN